MPKGLSPQSSSTDVPQMAIRTQLIGNAYPGLQPAMDKRLGDHTKWTISLSYG
jgi:hypothetical protein